MNLAPVVDHAGVEPRECRIVALTDVPGRGSRREAVLGLELVEEAAFGVDGHEWRNWAGILDCRHQRLQLLRRLDVPGLTGLGVHVVEHDAADRACPNMAQRRLGLVRRHAAEADQNHLADPVVQVLRQVRLALSIRLTLDGWNPSVQVSSPR